MATTPPNASNGTVRGSQRRIEAGVSAPGVKLHTLAGEDLKGELKPQLVIAGIDVSFSNRGSQRRIEGSHGLQSSLMPGTLPSEDLKGELKDPRSR